MPINREDPLSVKRLIKHLEEILAEHPDDVVYWFDLLIEKEDGSSKRWQTHQSASSVLKVTEEHGERVS